MIDSSSIVQNVSGLFPSLFVPLGSWSTSWVLEKCIIHILNEEKVHNIFSFTLLFFCDIKWIKLEIS